MGAFNKTFEFIERNKRIKDEGGYNSIPFGLPELDKHVPGIMKGTQYLVTASSGVGKTQLTKCLFVSQPYKFVKANPHLGIKLRIKYYALEESQTEFMLTLISQRLREEWGLIVDPLRLSSMGGYHLSDDILTKVRLCHEYFEDLEKSIEVIDNISNPFGIYKDVREYARQNGKFYFNNLEVDPGGMYDTYIANDQNEWVIIITDHISLLQTEKSEDANTLHGAMHKFSAEYCRKNITKHFRYAAVNVQQQAADKERLQFNHTGQSVEVKLEPSLDGLGDCKVTQRDAQVVLGLFGPNRYGIETHLNYDIVKLKDNYRCLTILKNRFGRPNLKLPLYFDGATNTFEQLPGIGTEELSRIYENVRRA